MLTVIVAETPRTQHQIDHALAQSCARGQGAAQRALFQQYRGRVHATLYRLLGSNRDVEDLIQEVFLEVFRSIGNFRGESLLSTWISTITTRVTYAYLSRRPPPPTPLEAVPDVPSDDPSAERRAMAREAARRLYAALDRMDPKYRIPFILHVVDGRPLREVAEMTEASLVATKSRVWRARREINRRAQRDPFLASFLAATDTDAGREATP
jgi:RNA polymerase sigma-70 factor (ECF subfamily)